MLGAHVGIGSDGVTEAGTVPNGLTRAGVIDANIQEWLRIHLQGSRRVAQAWDQTLWSRSGQKCSGGQRRGKGAPG